MVYQDVRVGTSHEVHEGETGHFRTLDGHIAGRADKRDSCVWDGPLFFAAPGQA